SPPDAPQAAARRLMERPPRPLACRVAGYWPAKSEFDARPVLAALMEIGATILLPRLELSAERRMSFRLFDGSEDTLEDGPFGLRQPRADAPAVVPDLILAPLLAFDRRGGRLGQGGGDYDRTIAALRERRAPMLVGLAYAAQEVDAVPSEPHDQRLDWIATERGLISCR
ncbi:MAG: 5-formyltetrahydrofolate cyclo-ligase, partial [Pseudomonadota bacterium]